MVGPAKEQGADYFNQCPANAAQEVEPDKPRRAPGLLHSGSEHPKTQHIEKQMAWAAKAVQEHVAHHLPDGKVFHHGARIEVQKLKNGAANGERKQKIEQVYRYICD